MYRAASVVGTATGFRADQRARRQRAEPAQKARPVELPPFHNPTGTVCHACHEDVRWQICTNRRSIHFDFAPHRKERTSAIQSWHQDTGRQAHRVGEILLLSLQRTCAKSRAGP